MTPTYVHLTVRATNTGTVNLDAEASAINFIVCVFFRAVETARSSGQHLFSPGEFLLKAPIYNPEKLICIGMNYTDHCTEQNVPVPVEPIIFSKFNSAITEPNGTVLLPEETKV